MRRIKLTLEYDGHPFHGFQRQKENLPTVQQAVEKALARITGETPTLQVAGRTDRGVHALGQVCHFDTATARRLINFKDGVNRFTPPEITVIKAEEVTKEFQARFTCVSRRYRYLIFNRREPSPFWAGRSAHILRPLDAKKMHKSAQALVGRHDFSSFRSPICAAKTPETQMHQIDITRKSSDLIEINIHGAAFLHNMVRIMCGCFVQVGWGDNSLNWPKELLEHKNRQRATLTLPPEGLYFMAAEYGPHDVLESC